MTKSARLRMENWACLLLLAGLALWMVWPFPWQQGVPAPLHGLTELAPWQEARPADAPKPAIAGQDILIQRYYPWCAQLRQAAQARELPLWNPAEGFGTPFLGLWRTRVFSPFSLPFYALPLPLPAAFSLSILLKLLVAGWAAYVAARRFAYAPPFAFLVAAAYQSSAPVLGLAAEPVADAMAWFPLAVFWGHAVLAGRPRAWVSLAGMLALTALGGSPETVGVLALFLLAVPAVRAARTRTLEGVWGAYLAVAGALLLAGMLAAFQWLPYLEYRGESVSSLNPSHGALRAADIAAFLLAPWRAAAEGTPARAALFLHVGVPALVAALWFAVRRHTERSRRRWTETFWITSLLFAAFALLAGRLLESGHGMPLPRSEHFLLPWGFAWALLAVAALEEWVLLDAALCRGVFRRFLLWLAGACALFIGGGAAAVSASGGQPGAVAAGAGVMAGVVFVLMLATAVRPSARLLGYGLGLAAAFGSVWALGPGLSFTPAAALYPETTFIAALREASTRVGGTPSLGAWPLSVHGVPQVYASSGVALRRHAAFMRAAEKDPAVMRRGAVGALLLTRHDVQGAYAGLRPELNIQEVFPSGAILLRDLSARPRARMIYAGKKVGAFSPTALIADSLPQIEGEELPEKDAGPAAAAEIVQPERNNRVVVRVAQTRPGVLVLADAFYPGWRVLVDGAPGRLVPVDGLFRGVPLGEGAHEVVFEYRPLSVFIGLIVSLVGFALLLLLLLLPHRRA